MAGGSGGNFAGGLADSPLTLTLTANSSTGVSAAASTGGSASGCAPIVLIASIVLSGSAMLAAVIGHT